MTIRYRVDDGTYWVVAGQPVMFDPPALTMERVALHYPDAPVDKCRRLSGAQWLDLVNLLEMNRARVA